MQEVKASTTLLDKKIFIDARPSIFKMAKKELDIFIIDLELEIRNYYAELKKQEKIRPP